jgi:uncharacterized protein YabE (DUF348 family)
MGVAMKNIFIKLLILIQIISVILCVSTGCTQDNVDVKINDSLVQTQISVKQGTTVKDILLDAEISLNKNDEVSPSENTKISKDTTINISRYVTATVVCDGNSKTVEVLGATVSDALDKAGVKLSKNDYVNYDLSLPVTDGLNITVVRRLSVTLTVDGKTQSCKTKAKTVKEFLNEQNVKLGKNDVVVPKLSKKLKENSKVTVKRVTTKKITKIEKIKYTTQYVNSSSLSAGTSKVTTKGVNGKKRVVYKVTYEDGKETSRKVIKETVIKEPVDEVVSQGTVKATTQKATGANGKTIVSKQRVDDCDGSGHGYFIIKYNDGTEDYEEY